MIGIVRRLLLPALLLAATHAQAQSWPDRPIKFISSQAAGNGTDVVGRLVADRLSARGAGPIASPEMVQAHLDLARAMVWDMATSPGFDATLEATLDRHYLAGPPGLDVPITVAELGTQAGLVGAASLVFGQPA